MIPTGNKRLLSTRVCTFRPVVETSDKCINLTLGKTLDGTTAQNGKFVKFQRLATGENILKKMQDDRLSANS
ncbi:hypothetical protein JM93_01239 [Roseibium hamelinense]|uniref:Uncharacterized protein n=1 Tax=Roseibium hamelinense TaxID=150831 RepID=A0A562TBN0_9HYPH|nr:hypothetical protein JM93_01239 [Roseibium hamelinense]